MDSFKKGLDSFLKLISVLAVLSFISGFIIWNFYLGLFGFSEYNLIQTRFIYSGFTFIFIASCVVLIPLYFLRKRIACSLANPLSAFTTIPLFIIIYFVFIYFYTTQGFVRMPGYLGGGKPILMSVIVKDKLDLLSPFLGSAIDSNIQTSAQCLVYRSDTRMIFLLNNRIVEIEDDVVDGFVRVPSKMVEKLDKDCVSYAIQWMILKPEQ